MPRAASGAEASFEQAMARAGRALSEVERLLSGPGLGAVKELTAALLDAHRQGLGALLDALEQEDGGDRRLARLAADPQVASLLALHGLHPDDVGARVRRGLGEANIALGKSGALELVGFADARADVRIVASSQEASELARRLCEECIGRHAPEVEIRFELPRLEDRGLVKLRAKRPEDGAT